MKNDNHLSENNIFEYLDGELSTKGRQVIEGHIISCPECQTRIEETRGLFTAIESLPEVSPPRSIAGDAIRALSNKPMSLNASVHLIRIPLILSIAALVILAAVTPMEPLNDWILLTYTRAMDILSIPMMAFQTVIQNGVAWVTEVDLQYSVENVRISADFLSSAQSIAILAGSSLLWYFSTKRMLPGQSYPLGRNGGI